MALAAGAQWRIRDCSSQNLANTAWAFAMVGGTDALLFAGLGKAVEWLIGDFNSLDLTNTAWAFATVG